MTPGWLVFPNDEPTPHLVRPRLGVTEDTLLPLQQLDPTRTDPDGTPMTFIGQFAAGEISNVLPSFTYWLYRSPGTRTFAQIEEHD